MYSSLTTSKVFCTIWPYVWILIKSVVPGCIWILICLQASSSLDDKNLWLNVETSSFKGAGSYTKPVFLILCCKSALEASRFLEI